MNVYEIITNRIIEQMEAGVAPWSKPWSSMAANGAPRNLVSNKPYRGINLLLLGTTSFSSPYFLTFNQAKALGGNVRKGSKGTPVVFWKFSTYESEDAAGETIEKDSVLCRYYTVFNLDQCENVKVPEGREIAPAAPDFDPIAECDRLVDGFLGKPEIRFAGDQAFYSPSFDYIQMPKPATFRSREEYYSTLFHELTHSTGHKTRLEREGVTVPHFFGDEIYSKEELVAELGAAFMCATAGIEKATINNSASYLKHWISVLKKDSRFLISAASQAQKAVDHMLGRKAEAAKEAAA